MATRRQTACAVLLLFCVATASGTLYGVVSAPVSSDPSKASVSNVQLFTAKFDLPGKRYANIAQNFIKMGQLQVPSMLGAIDDIQGNYFFVGDDNVILSTNVIIEANQAVYDLYADKIFSTSFDSANKSLVVLLQEDGVAALAAMPQGSFIGLWALPPIITASNPWSAP